MEWMDKVYLAHYDDKENTIANLKPYKNERHFYEEDLTNIENKLEESIKKGRETK
jgi:hypothetical protein